MSQKNIDGNSSEERKYTFRLLPGRGVMRDVEVRVPDPPQLRVGGEHPREGGQDAGLARPVWAEQVIHRPEVDDRRLRAETLEILKPNSGKAHDSPG